MPNTTAYSFGDVVLVPFPFTDQTASKKRPAVVVSADTYHQRRPDVIVMAVTSQILRPAGALGEVLISDWQGAGLPKASLIKFSEHHHPWKAGGLRDICRLHEFGSDAWDCAKVV